MQQHSAETDKSEEINLSDIFDFFSKNWKLILSGGLLGLVGSGLFLMLSSPQYQANLLVEMAQVRVNVLEPPIPVESGALFVERLTHASTYTPEVIKACDVEEDAPAVAMTHLVKAVPTKNLTLVVDISLRRKSTALAKQCVDALGSMIVSQQEKLYQPYINGFMKEKEGLQASFNSFNNKFLHQGHQGELSASPFQRDESVYLLKRINELDRLLSYGGHTKILALDVDYSKAYPKNKIAVIVGLLAGLLIGVFVALIAKIRAITK
jgi:hypothetical protein